MLTHDEVREIPNVPEAITVIGDMDNIFWYIRTGRALQDWNRRIKELHDQFDADVREHPNVWNHIIIPLRQ